MSYLKRNENLGEGGVKSYKKILFKTRGIKQSAQRCLFFDFFRKKVLLFKKINTYII